MVTFSLSPPISQGLAYLQMRPYTAHEYATIPHVIMISDQVQDPSYLDNDIDPTDPSFYENTPNLLHHLPLVDQDIRGEYIHTFQADVPISGPVPADAPADATTTPADVLVPADVSAPISDDPADTDPICLPPPSNHAAQVPGTHSVLRAHSNTHLSPYPMDDLASNSCADFDEFTAGCILDYVFFLLMLAPTLMLFGSMMLNTITMNLSLTASMLPSIWSHVPDLSSADTFDFHETNTYSVHELEFLAKGFPHIHTPSTGDYENM